MTAPPARAHIANLPLRPRLSRSRFEWDEADAWDSGSDSENVTNVRSLSLSLSSTTSKGKASADLKGPKPIPISTRSHSLSRGIPVHKGSAGSTGIDRASPSGGNLEFSYTHVQAPSLSSYPLKGASSNSTEELDLQERDERERAGWTIVRSEGVEDNFDSQVAANDADVDGDMVVGGFDPDTLTLDDSDDEPIKGKNAIREDAWMLAEDPFHALESHRSSPSIARRGTGSGALLDPSQTRTARKSSKTSGLSRGRSLRTTRKHEKVTECLMCPDVDLAELRKLAWSGLPSDLRAVVWPFLLGYYPLSRATRGQVLARKREEYASLVRLTFTRGKEGLDQQIWHQIEIDVPRTRPGVRLWMARGTQRSLERILYVWAIRHPASGYVQGINDLVTPFFQVFLSAYIDCDPDYFDPGCLPEDILNAIEADSFWCLSRLLDGIQDNYISHQPGIQRSVRRMQDVVCRIDAPLAAHLEAEGVEFMQFAFRWMNCLLMRELSVQNTIRMWDTYLSEGTDAFSQFHLYVCCAFLVKWSKKLREMDFQGVIMFLQSLPTQDWGDHEVELLLSEAFLLNSVWHNAQSHFSGR